MLSAPDMAVIGVLALLFFGPDQLPKVAKRVGRVVRDVQNTSASFLRELERAADDYEPPRHAQTSPAEMRSSDLPEDMRPSDLPEDMRPADLPEDMRPADSSVEAGPGDASTHSAMPEHGAKTDPA